MREKASKVQKVKQYILRNKVLVAVTAFLLIYVFATSGTVTSAVEEKELLNDQLQEQSEQYDELQNELDALSAQYDELQDDYSNLQSELTNYQDQQETIDSLNAQLTDLQEKYDALSAENEELKAEVAQPENSSGGGGTGSGGGILYIPGSSSESSNDSVGGMVWLSETGSKYHSIPDCGNMNPNTASQVSRSSAEAMGYDACKNCW